MLQLQSEANMVVNRLPPSVTHKSPPLPLPPPPAPYLIMLQGSTDFQKIGQLKFLTAGECLSEPVLLNSSTYFPWAFISGEHSHPRRRRCSLLHPGIEMTVVAAPECHREARVQVTVIGKTHSVCSSDFCRTRSCFLYQRSENTFPFFFQLHSQFNQNKFPAGIKQNEAYVATALITRTQVIKAFGL